MPDALVDLARIDRSLERLDRDIDHALDMGNRERFQDLLRLRGQLLTERSRLGGTHEPPC